MSWTLFETHFGVIAGALKAARANGRLAHAYLIHADQADVRDFTPLAIAQLRTCLNPAADMTPCGVCRHCTGVLTGTYPEMFRLMPTSKSRQIQIGKDKETPDSMRWFESQFYFRSSDGVKIGIINDAECMNEQSQNAFLKTLEEPPPETLFMLVSEFPSKLLPTVRSRCQLLSLLTNRCHYTQNFIEALPPILASLQTIARNNLPHAERAAAQLIEIAKGLKDEAARISAAQEDQTEEADQSEWTSAEKKWLEARNDAAVQSIYLSLRKSLVSAVYDWFALSWQRSAGIPEAQLANPELHRFIPAEVTDEFFCRKQLECAEALTVNFRYNVNEELCLRSFCLDAAFVC